MDADYQKHTITWPLRDGTVARVTLLVPVVLGKPVLAPDMPVMLSRGLGDTIAKATAAVGIRPCGGCKERRDKLNRAVPYRRRDGEEIR